MPAQATVVIDLEKITQNTRRVVDALGGIQVVGVTKVTCGSPQVARAMLAGGAVALADSRLENLEGLRQAGVSAPLWLLRAPSPELAAEAVRLADVTLESEIETIRALDVAAREAGRVHSVIAMVDLGDLREGVMPDQLPMLLAAAEALPGIDLIGIGASLTCYGAIVPDARNQALLLRLASDAEERLGRRMVISGGMSSSLHALAEGVLPSRIDNLRIGESILLGVSTVTREPIPGLHTDAILVSAPVIECQVKPSRPTGTPAQDAFGGRPAFEDRGERRRAILAIGRQDVDPAGIVPLSPGVQVLGASSDHLVLDVDDMPRPPGVGDAISFVPTYSATLRLFTSPYVRKEYAGA